jgi:subtilisin family serine protease
VTVGAVNIHGVWVGYSSEGPAALCDQKPDVCGYTHFKGYTAVDNGTSAAAPTVAGATALLRDLFPFLEGTLMHFVLEASARDLGPVGWDARFGHGVAAVDRALERAASAFYSLY